MKNLHFSGSLTLGGMLLFWAFPMFAQPTFINKIPIPPLIDVQNGVINLQMEKTFHKFNPGNPSDTLNGGLTQPNGIPTYAYNVPGSSNMSFLGPTLKWYTGAQTKIHVTNLIGEHTSTHWHGAELPAYMDGGPHEEIEPGETWTAPDFPILDSACTMWYHPHFHDHTVQHVSRGLSGMIIVEQPDDPIRNTLPHTYGVDDIPVILGDLGTVGGSSASTGYYIDTIQAGQGRKHPVNLVNGVTNPYVEVPAHLVRLRILNGSTRKGMIFGVSNNYNDPLSNLLDFIQTGTDGGYTLKPNTLKTLLNGPGARDEIILDLTGYPLGSKVYLRNLKELLPKFIVGSTLGGPNDPIKSKDSTSGKAYLELRIVADTQFPGYVPITAFTPFITSWSPGLADTSNISRRRTKKLVQIPMMGYSIDSISYEMERIDDTVCVNTKEIWTIHNISNVAHPFHIHKIQFRILDIVDSFGVQVNLEARGLNGPKDDVLVLPGWKLRFLGQFDDYPSPINASEGYMYHCHILTHEDAGGGGMMHQFVVGNAPECLASVGVETLGKRPEMALFPNPTASALYLKGYSRKPSTLNILDLHGRSLRSQQLQAFETETAIDIDGLSNGFYLVEWRTSHGVATGKFVKQQ